MLIHQESNQTLMCKYMSLSLPIIYNRPVRLNLRFLETL